MNEIVQQQTNLPATLDELSKFVLFNQERITAMRAEIRALTRLNIAKEVLEQKSFELNALGDAVIDAQVRVGQLTPKIPKAAGRPNNSSTHPEKFSVKTKGEAIRELGFSKDQVHEFEQMAKHPELVEQAKKEAQESGVMVTRSKVIGLIQAAKAKEDEIIEVSATEVFEQEKPAIDEYKVYKKLFNMIYGVFIDLGELPMDISAEVYIRQAAGSFSVNDIVHDIDKAIDSLCRFKQAIKEQKKIRVVKR